MLIYTMCNRVTHGDNQIDLEIIWRKVQSDLPARHMQISRVCAT